MGVFFFFFLIQFSMFKPHFLTQNRKQWHSEGRNLQIKNLFWAFLNPPTWIWMQPVAHWKVLAEHVRGERQSDKTTKGKSLEGCHECSWTPPSHHLYSLPMRLLFPGPSSTTGPWANPGTWIFTTGTPRCSAGAVTVTHNRTGFFCLFVWFLGLFLFCFFTTLFSAQVITTY